MDESFPMGSGVIVTHCFGFDFRALESFLLAHYAGLCPPAWRKPGLQVGDVLAVMMRRFLRLSYSFWMMSCHGYVMFASGSGQFLLTLLVHWFFVKPSR